MTDIQIRYWDYIEGMRHNYATETETNRHQVAQEKQAYLDFLETKRSHLANELQNKRNLMETARHNRITEFETQRSNMAREFIQTSTLSESIRHNKRTEDIQKANTRIANITARSRSALDYANVDKVRSDSLYTQQRTKTELEYTKQGIIRTATDKFNYDYISTDKTLNWFGTFTSGLSNLLHGVKTSGKSGKR